MPVEERWSARFFEPKDVFYGVNVNNGYQHNVENFYNLDGWDAYREYMLSDLARETQRPTKELFSYREFNRIAEDRD